MCVCLLSKTICNWHFYNWSFYLIKFMNFIFSLCCYWMRFIVFCVTWTRPFSANFDIKSENCIKMADSLYYHTLSSIAKMNCTSVKMVDVRPRRYLCFVRRKFQIQSVGWVAKMAGIRAIRVRIAFYVQL